MCSIVFCEHPFSRIFGIICNHLEFFWIFWFFLILTIILESIKIFWDFPDSFVSAGWHCRLFCSRILRILWNHLKYLGRPGTVAPQSYLAVLWVSWAPRVSRVSRALLIQDPTFTGTMYNKHWMSYMHCPFYYGSAQSDTSRLIPCI